MTTSTTPLHISSIEKSFGKQKVLSDVGFDLKPSEIFGLIGLNGAGKTTLIKIILDLLKPDAGNVSLGGHANTLPESRKDMAYLPEKFQPSKYLKGMEYLELTLAHYGGKLNREEARQKAADLSLDPTKLDSLVKTYSKGMGQKLGLIGAMMSQCKLLLLDEPMSGLDPSARIQLKRHMLSLKEEGRTLFFSSHILSDIEEICDRIGVIHNGVLLFVGTPKDFMAKYPAANLEQSFLAAIQPEASAAA